MFKLGTEADEFCIVFSDDYCRHIRKTSEKVAVNKSVIGKDLFSCYIRFGFIGQDMSGE